jgi:hypothetical protein
VFLPIIKLSETRCHTEAARKQKRSYHYTMTLEWSIPDSRCYSEVLMVLISLSKRVANSNILRSHSSKPYRLLFHDHISISVRFLVFTAATMKITVFWDIASRSLVEMDRRFRGARWNFWNVGQLLRDYTAPYPIILAQRPAVMTEGFRGFPESLKANAGIVS